MEGWAVCDLRDDDTDSKFVSVEVLPENRTLRFWISNLRGVPEAGTLASYFLTDSLTEEQSLHLERDDLAALRPRFVNGQGNSPMARSYFANSACSLATVIIR